MTPWYDTKEGIANSLKDLNGFHRLIDARRQAGYNHNEQLNKWFVLGRFHLDACGNCAKITSEFIPANKIPHLIKPIMTSDELWDAINQFDLVTKPNVITNAELEDVGFRFEENEGRPFSTSIGWSFESCVAPADILCPICNKGWDIDNCYNLITNRDYLIQEEDDVYDSVGMLAEDYENVLNESPYFKFIFNDIRNDKHIDLTCESGKTYPKNRTGHIDVDKSTYVLDYGDSVCLHKSEYYHLNCYALMQDNKTRNKIGEIVAHAGFDHSVINAKKNEYCGCNRCAPWYNVITPNGCLTIGWRKRVINIDFSELDLKVEPDFSQESVTQGDHSIHAWGYDKAEEYIKHLKECC